MPSIIKSLIGRPLIALAIVGLLAGCAVTDRYGAAGDVHALMISIRDDDRAVFDAHVDRRALEARLQTEMLSRARAAHMSTGLTLLGTWLSGPASRLAGDVLVQPTVFRDVASYYGYSANTPIPSRLSLAAVLTALPDGRVCATSRRRGACLLTFANEDGVWRMVDFNADASLSGLRRP